MITLLIIAALLAALVFVLYRIGVIEVRWDNIAHDLMKLVPNKVLYWAVVTAWARATTQHFTTREPDSLTWDEVCNFLKGRL